MQILFIFGPNSQVRNISLSRNQLIVGALLFAICTLVLDQIFTIPSKPKEVSLLAAVSRIDPKMPLQKMTGHEEESKLMTLQANLESAQRQLEQIRVLQAKLESQLSIFSEKNIISKFEKRGLSISSVGFLDAPLRESFDLRLDRALVDSFAINAQLDSMKDGVSPNWEYATLSTGSPPLLPPIEPSSLAGMRIDPFTNQLAMHEGLDLKANYGAPILATADGVVVRAGWDREYGYVVDLEHLDKTITRYAHAQQLLVKLGDSVKKAQVIAKVGSTGRSTGPHLHYEVIKNIKSSRKV